MCKECVRGEREGVQMSGVGRGRCASECVGACIIEHGGVG